MIYDLEFDKNKKGKSVSEDFILLIKYLKCMIFCIIDLFYCFIFYFNLLFYK